MFIARGSFLKMVMSTSQLHYSMLLCRTEIRYKRQFGSNSLLFTAFKTVQLDSRVSEETNAWLSTTPYPESLLLYEPYANESSQICPFLAVRPQFESVHHQNRRLSSHSYSHESVIVFVFLGSYSEFAFLSLTARATCNR